MIIPWTLLLTAACAAVPAQWWARRRARAAGQDPATPADVALTVGLAALVAARLVTLALDVALLGALPDVRAAISLGAGLSTPGAVLGGLAVGGWLARRKADLDPVWQSAGPPAALALALWSALSVVRGDVGHGFPVALVEAAAFAVAAVWLARTSLSGTRRAAAFGGIVAGVHLGGGLLRPTAVTVDADVDVLLGVAALLLCAAVAAQLGDRLIRAAAVVAASTALVAGLAAASAAAPAPPATQALGEAWGATELDTFIEEAGGRPVVVNFWASWCPPCHAEAPALAWTARALADEAAFIGVLIDDDPARAQVFSDRYALPFPTVVGGGLRHHLDMVGLPTTVVLAPDGSVSSRLIGGLDARSLTAAVRAAR